MILKTFDSDVRNECNGSDREVQVLIKGAQLLFAFKAKKCPWLSFFVGGEGTRGMDRIFRVLCRMNSIFRV